MVDIIDLPAYIRILIPRKRNVAVWIIGDERDFGIDRSLFRGFSSLKGFRTVEFCLQFVKTLDKVSFRFCEMFCQKLKDRFSAVLGDVKLLFRDRTGGISSVKLVPVELMNVLSVYDIVQKQIFKGRIVYIGMVAVRYIDIDLKQISLIVKHDGKPGVFALHGKLQPVIAVVSKNDLLAVINTTEGLTDVQHFQKRDLPVQTFAGAGENDLLFRTDACPLTAGHVLCDHADTPLFAFGYADDSIPFEADTYKVARKREE